MILKFNLVVESLLENVNEDTRYRDVSAFYCKTRGKVAVWNLDMKSVGLGIGDRVKWCDWEFLKNAARSSRTDRWHYGIITDQLLDGNPAYYVLREIDKPILDKLDNIEDINQADIITNL
jgi:hypothetical protein